MKQKESMKLSETMKQTKQTNSLNKCSQLHNKEFGTLWVVTNEKEIEGYFCLDDLCRILNLKEEVAERLTGHLFMVTIDGDKGQQYQKYYVDEEGLYLMMLFSKMEDAIRFQDWLNEVYLNNLREQRKARFGLDKNHLLVVEDNQARQVLRYMATAANVAKSGHFRVGKDIPALTMSHLMGWWNNPNDHSTFMLQFNCKTDCYIYENIRMNVYLTKDEDGHAELCDMTIKFLDPVDGEVHNYTKVHEVIRLFRMLQRVNDIRVATTELLRVPVILKPVLDGNGNMQVSFNRDGEQLPLCMLKYDGSQLKCIVNSIGKTFELDDSSTIDHKSLLIEVLSDVLRKNNE